VGQYRERDEYFDKDDTSEDSDCEGGLDQAGHLVRETGVGCKIDPEQDSLPILSIGSFASWRSMFFYLCVASIQFAPLKSQGVSERARYIQEQSDRNPHAPPPCSPKAIYSLAVALKIDPLRDLALSEIRLKTTSANVVNEFFSSSTSRRSEVMKMQYELLTYNFCDPDTTASVADLIKSMAGGAGAHHADALKFGLREGFSSRFYAQQQQPVKKKKRTSL